MPRSFRVSNLTINLGKQVDLDDIFCVTGTRGCLGRSILCFWPSQGCCGPVWSYPGGGGGAQISRIPTLTITWTDCRFGTECFISDGGCGLNYSTCPGRSAWDIGEIIDVVEDLRADLGTAVKELDERAPQIKAELEPLAAEEFDLAERELKAAMDRLKVLREQRGV